MHTFAWTNISSPPDEARGAASVVPRRSKSALIDRCGRRIDHLRLSVTSACNMACTYCQPRGGADEAPCAEVLTDDQRIELVRELHREYGLTQLRITGGEPLLHKSIIHLVGRLRQSAPDLTLAMTTNGRLLARYSLPLREAGLNRLNISLDSLVPATYRYLTGAPLGDVLSGIDAVLTAGFPPPKLNAVVLRGVNDSELANLARWAWARGAEMRFLEAMPIGTAADYNRSRFVSAREIRSTLRTEFVLTPTIREPGETAARYHCLGGQSGGRIGIIAPMTEPFCGQCRRMRVTAAGQLFPCLLDGRSLCLSDAWVHGQLDAVRLGQIFREALSGKGPFRQQGQMAAMVRIGG